MPESVDQQTTAPATDAGTRRAGLIYAVSAYVLWGFLPIYFIALAPTGAFEVVAWRIVFSLVFCAILLAITRRYRLFLALLKRPRIAFTMAAAGVLIYVNWQTYVYGTLSGQVVEASLGYFINPIVTVFLGVFFLREKLRPAQWAAVGISLVAVLVLAISAGSIPWIALTLAFSFGFYGYIKKRVGTTVDAVAGLSMETLWLLPVAVIQLLVVGATTGITFGTVSAVHTLLLIGTGVITAIPLLFFAAASRRLPLVVLGFIQYFAPIIQFLVGVLILNEAMSTARWVGFSLVWLALVILAVDAALGTRNGRRSIPELV
ncbi:EamA family transporter RarD [Microterricola viridarii]|uniref:Chloramphenicol-sensitive protein RarD n=1 Tax=Microterricola viridarii TaxID=412690 RepID=A0A1H1Q8M8_9MICO|nr:EamA family transporter RarD [Microterricola viridarii]SDS19269.1 chloramphenicol-sensitive protein RarD [Microterricola viridarii]